MSKQQHCWKSGVRSQSQRAELRGAPAEGEGQEAAELCTEVPWEDALPERAGLPPQPFPYTSFVSVASPLLRPPPSSAYLPEPPPCPTLAASGGREVDKERS